MQMCRNVKVSSVSWHGLCSFAKCPGVRDGCRSLGSICGPASGLGKAAALSWPWLPPVLCSPIPWHPDWWQKPAPSQKYHNGWKCCSAVLAFDVGKDYMPPVGATVVSLKAFYGQWQLGCAACSPIPVHPSDPILAPSPVRKHVETSNFLF